MVLVRKTELACRDGWDHDLWEPRAGQNDPREQNGRGLYRDVARTRPDTAASGDERATHLDRVSTSMDAVVSVRPGDRALAGQDSAGDGPSIEDRLRQARAKANAITQSNRRPPSSPIIDDGEDQVWSETISLRGLRSGRRGGNMPDDSGLGTPSVPSASESESPRAGWERVPSFGTAQVAASSTFHRPPEPSQIPDSETPESEFGAISQARFGQSESGFDREREETSEPVVQSGETEQFDFVDESENPAMQGDSDERGSYRFNRDELESEQSPDGFDEGAESLDSSFDTEEPPVSAHQNGRSGAGVAEWQIPLNVEQCCRTCRDFRPSGNGERGWCNNPYAFEKRQEVDAASLACRGAFGSWWAPTDDWWMERADISHHASPTPLVDEMIDELQAEHSAQNSTQTRRRS
jgi:hypothetical protein